jgi:hypothetical protein
MSLGFSFALPPLRIPGLGIVGQEPLPPEKSVSADLLNIWAIKYKDGGEPFDVDSIINLHYDHANKVSSFPIEKGGFVSYNKVNEPRTVKLKLTVGGGDRVLIFMADVERELTSTNLYTIITPEREYKRMTLEKVAYPRDAKSADQVVIDLTFIEIVQVSSQTIDAKVIPAARKKKSDPRGHKKDANTTPSPTIKVPRLSNYFPSLKSILQPGGH